jgi:hypothetical protein
MHVTQSSVVDSKHIGGVAKRLHQIRFETCADVMRAIVFGVRCIKWCAKNQLG